MESKAVELARSEPCSDISDVLGTLEMRTGALTASSSEIKIGIEPVSSSSMAIKRYRQEACFILTSLQLSQWCFLTILSSVSDDW